MVWPAWSMGTANFTLSIKAEQTLASSGLQVPCSRTHRNQQLFPQRVTALISNVEFERKEGITTLWLRRGMRFLTDSPWIWYAAGLQ